MTEHIPTEDFDAVETPTPREEAQREAQERIERRTELAKEQEILGRNRTRTQSRRENILREQRPPGADIPPESQSTGDPITAEEFEQGLEERGVGTVDRNRIDDSLFENRERASNVRQTAEDVGGDVVSGLTGAAGATGATGRAITESATGSGRQAGETFDIGAIRSRRSLTSPADTTRNADSVEASAEDLAAEDIDTDAIDSVTIDTDTVGENAVVDSTSTPAGTLQEGVGTSATGRPARRVSGGGGGFLSIGESIVPDSVERGLASAADAGGNIGSDVASFTTTPIREATGEAVAFAGGDEQGAEQTFDRVVSGAGSSVGRAPGDVANLGIDAGEVALGTGGAVASGDFDRAGDAIGDATELPGRAIAGTARQAQERPLETLGAFSLGIGGSVGLTRFAPNAVRSGVTRAGSGLRRATPGRPELPNEIRRFREDTRAQFQTGRTDTLGDADSTTGRSDTLFDPVDERARADVGEGDRLADPPGGPDVESETPDGVFTRGGQRPDRRRSGEPVGSDEFRDPPEDFEGERIDPQTLQRTTVETTGQTSRVGALENTAVTAGIVTDLDRLERAQTPSLEQDDSELDATAETTELDPIQRDDRAQGAAAKGLLSGAFARLDAAQSSVVESDDRGAPVAEDTGLADTVETTTTERTGIFAGSRTTAAPAEDQDIGPIVGAPPTTTPATTPTGQPSQPPNTGSPGRPRFRPFPDEERRRRRTVEQTESQPLDSVSNATEPLGVGWLSETFTGFAVGAFESGVPSRSALEGQPSSLFATGELPTSTLLSQDPETRAAVERVSDVFSFGTIEFGDSENDQ